MTETIPAPTRREEALLRALATRQGRRKSSCCRCEGLRAVRELLGTFPERVLFVAGTAKGLAQLQFDRNRLRLLSDSAFEALAGTVSPQGMIAVAEIPETPSGKVEGEFILALDQLGDPGNFGTIARGCRAAGVRELWYTSGSVDPWSDKSIRSGMGAQFGLRLRSFPSLAALLETADGLGFSHCFYADPHGGESIFECPGLFDRSVVLIGGEPNGSRADGATSVNIPMPGGYESINAAQAATVFLFESVRRASLKGLAR